MVDNKNVLLPGKQLSKVSADKTKENVNDGSGRSLLSPNSFRGGGGENSAYRVFKRELTSKMEENEGNKNVFLNYLHENNCLKKIKRD